MFCPDCGAENKETAAFCRKCGAAFEGEVLTRVVERTLTAEDETRVASPRFARLQTDWPVQVDIAGVQEDGSRRRLAQAADVDREREIFSISPTLFFVKIGYGIAVVGALLLVAFVSAFAGGLISTTLAVVLGLLLLLIPGYHHLMTRMIRYSLSERTLRIDQGLIARSTRNVPLKRIQDVTVSSRVAQRLLGIGDVIIDNASEEGGKVVLKNIDDPRGNADKILKQMARVER